MYKREQISTIEDLFISRTKRKMQGSYFARVYRYNDMVHNSIFRYIKEAGKKGSLISGRIENPNEKQLSYYDEIVGRDFQLSVGFFDEKLKEWLPRVKEKTRNDMSLLFYDILFELKKKGKTDNMLKNAYIKFMCWLYYKFEQTIQQVESEEPPKVIFEGNITQYELYMFFILSQIGSDVLLVEKDNDQSYQKLDKENRFSNDIKVNGKDFPEDFNIEKIQKDIVNEARRPAVVKIERPDFIRTNNWLSGNVWEDIIKKQTERGFERNYFYNTFVAVYGAEDPVTYYADLLKWKLKLESVNKNIVIIEEKIPSPTFDEVNAVNRGKFASVEEVVSSVVDQFKWTKDSLIEQLGKSAFVEIQNEFENLTVQKSMNIYVTLLCWLNRYVSQLLAEWNRETTPVFIYYGRCQDMQEQLFLKMIRRLPIDILIINPVREESITIEDPMFFEKKYEKTLKREVFPQKLTNLEYGTTAFQAERELDELLYQDTGIYRNHQFQTAIPVSLKMTYEEIFLLWKEGASFRPNFETFSDKVMVPVICSKILGVKNSVPEYWETIADLIDENTILAKEFPLEGVLTGGKKAEKVTQFYKKGRLNIEKMRESSIYSFSFLSIEKQEYLIDKLEQLIESNIIKGTRTGGTEYTIISTVLSLDNQILRAVQKYDFTKEIPKLLVISTKETRCTIEDSIVIAYLNLIGFDIAIFVPTGYMTVEQFYEKPIFIEHQLGEYKYELQIPKLENIAKKKDSIVNKIFKRGR